MAVRRKLENLDFFSSVYRILYKKDEKDRSMMKSLKYRFVLKLEKIGDKL